jgi:phosphoribosylpyrophosphate synthetase
MDGRYGFLRLEPKESEDAGWIYAFGVYYPRHQAIRHHHSDWSRAVILAKRGSAEVIDRFGGMIAGRIHRRILASEDYVITHVPAEPGTVQYLFGEYARGAPDLLAESIHRNLGPQRNVTLASLLVTVRPKARKQHQCGSPTERTANVRGLYTVSDRSVILGRTIILVDDVLTTGATMRECAQALWAAGARNVMGVVLARTVHGSDLDTGGMPEMRDERMPEYAMVAG